VQYIILLCKNLQQHNTAKLQLDKVLG